MSNIDGWLMVQEIADRFGIPKTLATRLVDRLGLGTRFKGSRIVHEKDLFWIAVALRGMDKLNVADFQLMQSELVAPDSVSEVP
jgi:hypothetical protein